jgi:hypothetical protein
MARCSVRTVVLALLACAGACGTDAVGVDTCRRIESERCMRAPGCGFSLQPPYHTSGTDVAACVRFYDEACLHGLAGVGDPGRVEADQCVAAIGDGGCSVVLHPESDPACAWLNADAGGSTDAATDAASADATSE